MGEGFKKLKRKSLRNAIIKSAVCGLSCGIFAACAILLAFKLLDISLNIAYYILIGVSTALICGNLTFIISRPTDKKLAQALDKKYALEERVQTALEFQGVSGTVVEVQRQDAENRLSSLPKAKFGQRVKQNFARVWQYFVIVVLAVAMAVAAMLVPAKSVEGGTIDSEPTVEETPFEMSEEQFSGLNAIIANVKASALQPEVKDSAVALLEELREDLSQAQWVSNMLSLVRTAITKIDKLFTNDCSYTRIANALVDLNQYKFAVIIADGVQVYKAYDLEDYEQIKTFEQERVNKVVEAIDDSVTKELDALAKDPGNTPAEIYTALAASKIAETDALYSIFFDFAKGLAQDGVTSALKVNFNLALTNELARQAYTCAVKRYVILNLGNLFDIGVPDDPDFIVTDDSDDKTNQGGYGDGSWKHDYSIYNPYTGEYENYMDVLADYYAIVDAMLRDPEQYTEEQIRIIRTYFEILFSGAVQ